MRKKTLKDLDDDEIENIYKRCKRKVERGELTFGSPRVVGWFHNNRWITDHTFEDFIVADVYQEYENRRQRQLDEKAEGFMEF